MAKPVRKILSPEQVKAVDEILENRHKSREHQKQDRERNDRLLTPDGGVDVTNREAQMGRRISRADFVRRLQKLNPNLRYQQSKFYPKQGGIYIVCSRRDNVLGIVEFGEWFVCGIPHEVIGEFSVRLTKPTIVPHLVDPTWDSMEQVEGMERGWRAVLYKLLMDGILTHTQIDNEFQISKGRSSKQWQTAVN